MNSELILVESKSARDGKLSNTTHEQAENALSKAKALLHFAIYQGNKIATTEQVAEFYQVSVDTIRGVFNRHKDELTSDGVTELKGQTLKTLRSLGHESLQLPGSVTRLTTWTPRAALRVGMILRDSEIAKSIRTVILNEVEESGKKSERIQELELQLAIAEANKHTVLGQERLMLRAEAIVNMHDVETLALIQGRPDAVVTKTKVIDQTVIADQSGRILAKFNGMGITEIAKELGFKGKNANKQCKAWLRSVGVTEDNWRQEMTAHASAKLPRELMPKLKQLWAQRRGDRQMLLGEGES